MNKRVESQTALNPSFPVALDKPAAPEKLSTGGWIMSRVMKGTALIRNRNVDVERCKDVWGLIQKQAAMKNFLSKGMGLSYLKKNGVLLQDMIDANYQLSELRAFPEINNPASGIEALLDWGLTPDMIVKYKKQLPIAELQQACGLNPRFLSEKMGIGFDERFGLVGADDKPGKWDLDKIMYLGMNRKEILKAAGLKTKSQWLSLNASASQIAQLDWTDADFESLIDDLRPKDEDVYVSYTQQPPVNYRQHYDDEDLADIAPTINRYGRRSDARRPDPQPQARRPPIESRFGNAESYGYQEDYYGQPDEEEDSFEEQFRSLDVRSPMHHREDLVYVYDEQPLQRSPNQASTRRWKQSPEYHYDQPRHQQAPVRREEDTGPLLNQVDINRFVRGRLRGK